MSLFRRQLRTRRLDPGDWRRSAATTPRILVEHPDRGELWARAEILREAGYQVSTCAGPHVACASQPGTGTAAQLPEDVAPLGAEERLVCPLAAGGDCLLVEGADVVVTTTELVDSAAILAAHRDAGRRSIVVEGPAPALVRAGDIVAGAILVEEPVTEFRLLAAVREALGRLGSATQAGPAA